MLTLLLLAAIVAVVGKAVWSWAFSSEAGASRAKPDPAIRSHSVYPSGRPAQGAEWQAPASDDATPWLAASSPATTGDSASEYHHYHRMGDSVVDGATSHHHTSHHQDVPSDSSSVDFGGHHTSHDSGPSSDSSSFDFGGGGGDHHHH